MDQNKIFSFLAFGLLVIAKRYIELVEQSELVIEKAIMDRQQKQLYTFFMNQADATFVYSLQDNQQLEDQDKGAYANYALDANQSRKKVNLEIFNSAVEEFTGINIKNTNFE